MHIILFGRKGIGLIAVLIILSLFSGCSSYTVPSENTLSETEIDNPFTNNEEQSNTLSHGAASPPRAEDGSTLPFEYSGGEFVLDYFVIAEGTAKNVGFLVFLDGEPIAFKIDGESEEYTYLHHFDLETDGEEYNFQFIFTPTSGKTGETLNLSVVSIYYSAFQPDMVSTTSYGMYHWTLPSFYKLYFSKDVASGVKTESVPAVINVQQYSEKVTDSFLRNDLLAAGYGEVSNDDLNDSLFYTVDYNGEVVYDNLGVSDEESIHVTYKMCGTPGTELKTTFYLNHKPITNEEVISYDVTLTKGDVYIIEADIDISQMSEINTFYIVTVSTDTVDSSVYKTQSICLYQE